MKDPEGVCEVLRVPLYSEDFGREGFVVLGRVPDAIARASGLSPGTPPAMQLTRKLWPEMNAKIRSGALRALHPERLTEDVGSRDYSSALVPLADLFRYGQESGLYEFAQAERPEWDCGAEQNPTPTVYLSPDVRQVQVGEIAELFARAIHPLLGADTPREVKYLQKEATSSELASAWCGEGNNFPLSLTDDDVSLLNSAVWPTLSPLALAPDTLAEPRRLARSMTEPDWQAYADALARNPQKGWRLVVVWRNPVVEQWVLEHAAVKEWREHLRILSVGGVLQPQSGVSYLPKTGLTGAHLDNCFLSRADFATFAQKYGLQVRTRHQVERDPLASAFLSRLALLPSTDLAEVTWQWGRFSGRSACSVGSLRTEAEMDAARQREGYVTVAEAEELLARAHRNCNATKLVDAMHSACRGTGEDRRRIVRRTDKVPLQAEERVSRFAHLLRVRDVDWWLEHVQDVPYRLAPLLAEYRGERASRAESEGGKSPAPPLPFNMSRSALVSAHKHEWPTIEADLKDASKNGLAEAKAGKREWNEMRAMEWARAKGKLRTVSPVGELTAAMRRVAPMPSRTHRLER